MVILAIAGLVAGYFGGVWLALDTLSHVRSHLMGAIAALALAMVLGRFWPAGLIAGAIATVLWAGGWPLPVPVSSAQQDAAAGEIPVRIVSYNIGGGPSDLEAVGAYLRRQSADVAILQGVGPQDRGLLDALDREYPHRTECISQRNCELVILAKHPLSNTGYNTGDNGPGVIWATLAIATSSVTAIGVNLDGPWLAARQFEQIKQIAGQTLEAEGPVLVAGDFHAGDESIMLLALQEFAGIWRITNLPTWPTWFFGLPQFATDHIFVSGDLRPLQWPQLGKATASSHLPIETVLALPVAQ